MSVSYSLAPCVMQLAQEEETDDDIDVTWGTSSNGSSRLDLCSMYTLDRSNSADILCSRGPTTYKHILKAKRESQSDRGAEG